MSSTEPRDASAHGEAAGGGQPSREEPRRPEDDAGRPEQEAGGPAEPGREAPAGEPTPAEQIAELKDRFLRARADLENVRRRARLDVEDARRYGAADLLKELLPVLDTLQRALAAAREGEGGLLEGLQLTEQMFEAVLHAHGVTRVPTIPGERLDPTVQRAVVEQPTAGAAPGTIVAELVPGYRLHDRLLREAQVAVARAPAPGDGQGTPEDPDADV